MTDYVMRIVQPGQFRTDINVRVLENADPVTAKVELTIYHSSVDEFLATGYQDSTCIPGPHLQFLLVFRNPVFIFLSMTLGYFRNIVTESLYAKAMQDYLRRNPEVLKKRKKEIGYGI